MRTIWLSRSPPPPHKPRSADGHWGQSAMSSLIDYAISHARLTIVTLLFLLGAGQKRETNPASGILFAADRKLTKQRRGIPPPRP